MRLDYLWLINFKSHENRQIEFKQNNIISGPNGIGKTNILEAIDILVSTKSKLTNSINKCIRHKTNGFILTGRFYKDDGSKVENVFKKEKNNRQIKINDNLISKSSDLLGLINSVIFLPNDLDIIQGAPADRRKYLDILISQTDKKYYEYIQKYLKCLKNRNELLKGINKGKNKETELTPWNIQLAELMSKIYVYRAEIISQQNIKIKEFFYKITNNQNLEMKYATDVENNNEVNLSRLTDNIRQDIFTGHTNYGIHKDDIGFVLDEMSVSEYCSQGQKRLVCLCLKLAEADLKKEILKDNPILLIDDVLLELDLYRFNKIIGEISQESQKIYTMTDTKRLSSEILESIKIINL